MKYNTDDAMKEVLRRSELLIKKQHQKKLYLLSASSIMMFLALVMIIPLFSGGGTPEVMGTVYGSYLLPAEAGGYVITAVIAFIIGTVTTLLCLRYKKNHKKRKEIHYEINKDEEK